MKKNIILLLVCSMTTLPLMADSKAGSTQHLLEQSRQAAKTLGKELKQTLQMSMKQKGPVESIRRCNIKAPEITAKVSLEKNMKVSRTSLKYRNKNNRPDAWEAKVLRDFEERKKKGEAVSSLEYYEVTKQKGENVFRYMKAIPTAEVCLVCHGGNIAGPVAARIKSLYPDDRATGFKVGDIRGAFSITQVTR